MGRRLDTNTNNNWVDDLRKHHFPGKNVGVFVMLCGVVFVGCFVLMCLFVSLFAFVMGTVEWARLGYHIFQRPSNVPYMYFEIHHNAKKSH